MNIGQKIKALRMEKFMTQSELAGSEITRNMLSRIENGAAQPSLDTLRYLAARLNVSPGFLLAEEGDESIYVKHNEIRGIKKAFLSEDYRICRDMCQNSQSNSDDEIQMILSECDLAIGIEEFRRGNLHAACEFFDEALESCGNTVYRTEGVLATAGVYFRYMRRFSATLSSGLMDEREVNIYPALTDSFCRYAIALERLESGNESEAVSLMQLEKRESPYSLHLEAKLLMQSRSYAEAYENLRTILHGELAVAEPMLYYVFCDLEICCREIEDFRGAYEYSIDKIELLQKMLT